MRIVNQYVYVDGLLCNDLNIAQNYNNKLVVGIRIPSVPQVTRKTPF